MKQSSVLNKLRSRKGLNLIELAIVMAVVGLIVGGIYIAASSVYRNVREEQTLEDVLQIVQNVKSTFGTAGSITSGIISNAVLVNAGVVPADMVGGTASSPTLGDAFGGNLAVIGNTTPTPNQVTIALSGLPQSVCSDLIIKSSAVGASGAANSGLIGFGTSANTAGAPTGNMASAAFPVTVGGSAITTACPTAGNNVLSFVYSIE